MLPTLALQFGWRFGDVPPEPDEYAPPTVEMDPERLHWSIMPYLSLGMQTSVTNTGFEPDFSTLASDSLETLWMGYFGVGVDALVEKLVLGTSLIVPIEGEDAIDFGVVFNFRVGVQL